MPTDSTAATEALADRSGSTDRMGRMAFPTVILKTGLDRVGALLGLVVLSPVLIAIALVLAATQGAPIFFRHARVGKDGRTFGCLKFRTMVPQAPQILQKILESDPIARAEWETSYKLSNDPRVTPFGRFLRKTSLDELPQLWNVLVGDMSLVGPRPVTAQEGQLYGAHFSTYKAVRPGVTGLWQVSGRSDISYADRVALDVAYVRSVSFVQDLRILLLTVYAVLARKGAV